VSAGAVPSWRRDALITLALLALLLAWDASGLDLAVARGWGGPAGFAWRDRWLTATLLHDGGRVLAGVVLLALAVHALRPLGGALTAAERWRWLAVTLAALLLVPLIKRASLTSCPWELAEFGGAAHYVSHWALGIADGGPGHCFPSGHATSAFAFLGGWFALRERHPAAARLWLATVVAFGVLLGAAQTVRGAHYPSHTLWTGWLCWTLAWLASLPWRQPAAAATAVPAR
jgi:membrane-associated PAP2 superfamily phosphatase